jgi:hypothetical protein
VELLAVVTASCNRLVVRHFCNVAFVVETKET